MGDEVGSASYAIFPTFRGFRSAIAKESTASKSVAASIFQTGFAKAGTDSGKAFGAGFKSSTAGITTTTLKRASEDVARASAAVSAARLKEQDATGKVRVAEAQLADARARYSSTSAQVVRAEERLSSAQRAGIGAMQNVVTATDKLATARKQLNSVTVATPTVSSGGGGFGGTFTNLFGNAGTQSAGAFGTKFRSAFPAIFSGNLLADVVQGAAFKFGQAIGAGIDLGFSSVDLASNLEQSTGAVEQVFKDQSAIVFGFAKESATNVGLAQAKYQDFAKVVGSQLKNLGIPFDQVAGKTNDLITLGADLSAQFGGDTSTAVQALSSLLRGERDPIERYGVSIKQADINARVAAMGLGELTDEQQKQAEIQATLAILWEQTADAQGTFFRESDTYAHKQQVLNAQLEEAQTRLGEALLPAFSGGLDFINTSLLPKLNDIVDAVGPKLAGAMETAGPKFEELWEKAEPLVTGFLSVTSEEGIPALLDLMQQVVDAAPGWFEAFQTLGEVGNFLDDLSEGFNDAGLLVNDFFFGSGREARMDGFGQWVEDVNAWAEPVNQAVNDFLAAPLGQVNDIPRAFGEAGANAGKSFADGIDGQRAYARLAAYKLADDAYVSAKNALQIASPSKKAQYLADQFGGGFVNRLDGWRTKAKMSAERMVSFGDLSSGALLPSATEQALASISMPSELVVVDSDRVLVGRMRVEAGAVVGEYDDNAKDTINRGRRSR